MKRRDFIALLAAAGALPAAAGAQHVARPKIGLLIPANAEPFWSDLRGALQERGYVDGRTAQFEFRSADGRPDRLPALADELVRLRVDVIVASLTPAAIAARQATAEIPIVMAGVGDPVATGLVASLARPGGNVTGLSGTTTELGSKILELIREMLPATRRVGVLANAADPFTKPFLDQIEAGGSSLGFAIQSVMVRDMSDFEGAFAAMAKEHADAVIVQPSLPRKAAADLAVRYRLPPISPFRLFPQEGGLMSYSANHDDLHRRVASYVDRVLKGTRPADLPVEQPTKYDLVINLRTAKALGIDVPLFLQQRADEVIE
jgi:putative ABC transport system substrate-binding protein